MKGYKNITNTSTFKRGGKTVATPIAHTTTVCEANGSRLRSAEEIETSLALISKKDMIASYATICLLVSGSRVSEVLCISPSHITGNGCFKIEGKKNSNSRVYYDNRVANYLIECKKNCVYPFERLNRFYLYRLFNSANLYHTFEGNKKKSVTHFPRHLKALDALEVDNNNDVVSDILRHKSLKNKSFYEKKG
jgi:integrase